MANHTPGRMKAGGASVSVPESEDLPGLEAKLYGGNGQSKAANARRIAACWNACEGITTDELEHIASTGGMLGPREDVARIASQRDEVLEALEKIATSVDIDTLRAAIDCARAAIAKVKEGAL